jgi:tetratricopeptide (TPR) repeat protein
MRENLQDLNLDDAFSAVLDSDPLSGEASSDSGADFEDQRYSDKRAQNNVERSFILLRQASGFLDRGDWIRGESLASEAIGLAPNVSEGYEVRGRARRHSRKFPDAIEDYTVALKLDPQNSNLLMFRGATRMDQAAFQDDYNRSIQIMNVDAHNDFQTAAKLSPDDLRIGLSILEVEVCTGSYRDAAATAGLWWNRTSHSWKIICAWLGALALILARRPRRRWRKFGYWLEVDESPAGPDYWNPCTVERFLRHVEENGCETECMSDLVEVHQLFLDHHRA